MIHDSSSPVQLLIRHSNSATLTPRSAEEGVRTLLLVDNNPDDVAAVVEMLLECERLAIDLYQAPDLDAASEWLADHHADLSLLELNLEKRQGVDTLQEFRRRHPMAPVMVLSAEDDLETVVAAAHVGVHDYLVKGQFGRVRLERAVVQALERRSVERQILQAQRLEAVGRLAGGVAHDFNNLLMVIQGYATLLRDDVSLTHAAESFASTIVKASERGAALTQQLLAFSRQQVMSRGPVDVNKVVRESRDFLERTIGEQIEVELDLHEDLETLIADDSQLQQVVLNLAINARDAMPGGGTLTISTSMRHFEAGWHQGQVVHEGDYIVVRVADDGVGMTRETLSHIFDPFFTTKGPEEGTGLGLATVYGIVKQSGGFVWVFSEKGKGTTFEVHLPVDGEPHEPTIDATHLPKIELENRTVMLVEDDESVRLLTQRILEEAGYTVIDACSGVEALEIVKERWEEIDLLVTDVIMPRMNGAELAEAVSSVAPKIRTLFISGYSAREIRRAGLLTDEAKCLKKPYQRVELLSTLQELAARAN